jgi:hypothetical protein
MHHATALAIVRRVWNASPDCEYVRRMSKAPRPATTIKFEAMLAAENEWQVVATFPTAQSYRFPASGLEGALKPHDRLIYPIIVTRKIGLRLRTAE